MPTLPTAHELMAYWNAFSEKLGVAEQLNIVAIVVSVIGIGVAAVFAYRQLLRTPKIDVPTLELRLWDHGSRWIEGYLTVRNTGRTTATVDRIWIKKPKNSRIGWPDFDTKERFLKEPAGDEHLVEVRVEPGKSAGTGMSIELHEWNYPPPLVAVTVRVWIQDRRRPIIMPCETSRMERAIKAPDINGKNA